MRAHTNIRLSHLNKAILGSFKDDNKWLIIDFYVIAIIPWVNLIMYRRVPKLVMPSKFS